MFSMVIPGDEPGASLPTARLASVPYLHLDLLQRPLLFRPKVQTVVPCQAPGEGPMSLEVSGCSMLPFSTPHFPSVASRLGWSYLQVVLLVTASSR